MVTLHNTLGSRIYLARVYAGRRTLRDFGEAVAKAEGRPKPYNESSVSDWEANRTIPSYPALLAIAVAAPVPPEWLLLNQGKLPLSP